jgi:hypothetical protein
MNSTLLYASAPSAATIATGLVMVRLGFVWGVVESRYRTRWCASCHRRVTGRVCRCGREQ